MRDRTTKAQLMAAAESYAKVSPFADACYRYYYYEDATCHAKLSACLVDKFAQHLQSVPAKYHQAVIDTALTELSYPANAQTVQPFVPKSVPYVWVSVVVSIIALVYMMPLITSSATSPPLLWMLPTEYDNSSAKESVSMAIDNMAHFKLSFCYDS